MKLLLASILLASVVGQESLRGHMKKPDFEKEFLVPKLDDKLDESFFPDGGAVYTMTNEPTDNKVLVYSRDTATGMLDFVTAVSTGGSGFQLAGDPPSPAIPTDDPLASQDSLVVAGNCLLAVNAGSNTVSSFLIKQPFFEKPSTLKLTDVTPSGGEIPVSIAVHPTTERVYVLNAGGIGSIGEFRLSPILCKLTPVGKPIQLDQEFSQKLGPPSVPFFPASPAQIGITPGGDHLLVTIKANGAQVGDGSFPASGSINKYAINTDAFITKPSISADVVKIEIGGNTVPFSFTFDDEDRLLLVEAFGVAGAPNPEGGTVSLLSSNLTTEIDKIATTQTTTCWIQYNDKKQCVFTTNNGGGSISSIKIVGDKLKLKEGFAAGLDTPIDFIFSPDEEYLYALSSGHLLSSDPEEQQPAIFVYKILPLCKLELIQEVTNGLPSEAQREPNSLGAINGVVGMAVH